MLPIKRWRQCRKWNAIVQRIREVPRLCVVPGYQFAAALSLHCSVRPSRRASLASVTASKRHCAPSIRNTPALSHAPLIGLNNIKVGCASALSSPWVRETAISSLILPRAREDESTHEWHFKIPRSHRGGGLASATTF